VPRPDGLRRAQTGGLLTILTPFAADLLTWYDTHARTLPWRVPPKDIRRGITPNPYRVWLSEIMLQQTTVKAVAPFYAKFLGLWPDVSALAMADENAVLAAWAGLGYYSRARNMKRCAETIHRDHGGRFPKTKTELLALPGIGDYTASAIAAIAFKAPEAVIDGNVERVSSRVVALEQPMPLGKPAIRAFVETHVPTARPGDFAQAMMDLGATICTPKSPACTICPVAAHCAARGRDPARFPLKAAKAGKPLRRGAAFIAVRADGAIWLERRPAKGLLAGMSQPPTSGWTSRQDGATGSDAAPFPGRWRFSGGITHVFTHFTLELAVWRSDGATPSGDGWWSKSLDAEALPALMRKAIIRALEG
jgi:A/G-specific adenine glycosylase